MIKYSSAEREAAAEICSIAATTPGPTFAEAWQEKEAEGYRYGGDALENVEFGWDIAVAKFGDALTSALKRVEELQRECELLHVTFDEMSTIEHEAFIRGRDIGRTYFADEERVLLRAALAEAVKEIEEHHREYKYVTPKEAMDRLRALGEKK